MSSLITLNELCYKITDGAHHSPKAVECGVPMFSVKDMIDQGFDYSKPKTISEEDYLKLIKSGCQPEVGDILIAKDGSVLKHIFYVKEKADYVLLSSIAILKPKIELVDSQYLVYALKEPSKERDIRTNYVSGSGVPRIVLKDFGKVKINLPPLPEQKAIAGILGKLDNKIELNRQMNQTLEQMAQALFQIWFVDFDPVIDNALAQGNPIPETLTQKAENRKAVVNNPLLGGDKGVGTLPEDLQKLFPNKFTFNDTLNKWIPEGWEVKSLGELTVELRRGISPKYIEEGGVLVLNQKCIRNHEVNYSLARRNDPTKKKVEGRFLQPGDMVVNSTGTGTLGRVANVLSLDEPTVVDSHVTVVRADEEKVLTNFFNGLIFSIEAFIEAMGEGSTGQTELSRARLSEVNVIVPSMATQELISNQLGDFYSKKDSNNKQTETLTQLREVLLPQLISGKLSVPEAMLAVEKVVG